MFVIFVMLYLSTRLVEYSVNPGINRGAHKLAGTPQVIYKKKKDKKPKEVELSQAYLTLDSIY
jgi:hypothetical protein